MKELRLKWEPKTLTSPLEIEEHVSHYIKGQKFGATILSNGTLLFTPANRDNESDAKKAMKEAKYLIDFRVIPMKDSSFLVKFHNSVAVFVGAKEFKSVRMEIISRINELKFPEEVFYQEEEQSEDNFLIGLYARGKLQYDAYNFSIYKRIDDV